MSEDITKKQHYVWRHYLSTWKNNPDDKGIWTGLLEQKVIRKISLMDVAQKSYFYKLEELTDAELDFLKNFSKSLPEKAKSVAEDIVNRYSLYMQMKRNIATNKTQNNDEYMCQVKKTEAETIETIQSKIENLGFGLIKCQNIKDVQLLVEESEDDILYYLFVQYSRTRAMKSRAVESMQDREDMQEIAQKCWPFFNLVCAKQLAENMAKKNDYRFVYVHNKGRVPFIAGDQPVINAKSNDVDENGFAKDLELYYPLSPKAALVIEFTQGERFSEIDVDDDYVRQHNLMIAKEAQFHIFANEEGVLNNIIDEIRPL